MRRLLLTLVLVAGCTDAPTTTRAQRTTPRRPEKKPPKTLVQATPSPPPKPIPSGPGPLPAADTEEGRRGAVFAVLAGGSLATSLPERAADPEHPFDAGLAAAMTPTAGRQMPRVRPGDSTVEGGLPKEVVRRIVRRYMGQLRGCYEKQLAREAGATGTLSLTFTIDARGTLSASKATSKAFDALMTKCVEEGMERWRFPLPKDGKVVEVTYDLLLSPV